MSGGGGTNTTTTSTQPPAAFQNAYTQLLGQAQGIASQPYQQYQGSLLAPLAPGQTAGIDAVYNAQGVADPFINAAAQSYGAASRPLLADMVPYSQAAQDYYGASGQTNLVGAAQPWQQTASGLFGQSSQPVGINQFSADAVQQYESPYTDEVVRATQDDFAHQNQIQQQGVIGNAIGKGAWGGDRSAVAQALTAGEQARAQAPVIAGLRNQGYAQALGQFNNQQQAQLAADIQSRQLAQGAGTGILGVGNQAINAAQGQGQLQQGAASGIEGIARDILGANQATGWLNAQAGSGYSNLANQAQNSSLAGANALLGVGALQQNQAQQGLNIPYQQWLAQQAYPYQQASWLQGIGTNLGAAAGGTGTTTSPAASPISQIGGLATGALGLASATGGFGQGGWLSSLFGSGAGGGGTVTDSLGSILGTPWTEVADGGAIPHREYGGGIVLPFPARPRSYGGGIIANDNSGWPPPARRAAGGPSPLVYEIPGLYEGARAVPQIGRGSGIRGTSTDDYLADVLAGAGPSYSGLTGLPAPSTTSGGGGGGGGDGGTGLGGGGIGGFDPGGGQNAGGRNIGYAGEVKNARDFGKAALGGITGNLARILYHAITDPPLNQGGDRLSQGQIDLGQDLATSGAAQNAVSGDLSGTTATGLSGIGDITPGGNTLSGGILGGGAAPGPSASTPGTSLSSGTPFSGVSPLDLLSTGTPITIGVSTDMGTPGFDPGGDRGGDLGDGPAMERGAVEGKNAEGKSGGEGGGGGELGGGGGEGGGGNFEGPSHEFEGSNNRNGGGIMGFDAGGSILGPGWDFSSWSDRQRRLAAERGVGGNRALGLSPDLGALPQPPDPDLNLSPAGRALKWMRQGSELRRGPMGYGLYSKQPGSVYDPTADDAYMSGGDSTDPNGMRALRMQVPPLGTLDDNAIAPPATGDSGMGVRPPAIGDDRFARLPPGEAAAGDPRGEPNWQAPTGMGIMPATAGRPGGGGGGAGTGAGIMGPGLPVPPAPPDQEQAAAQPGTEPGRAAPAASEYDRHANPWLAVAEAGFAAAAGRSPNALSNIAAGAAQGVRSYVSAESEARKLSQQADEVKARLAETGEYHRASIEARNRSTDVRAERNADLRDIAMIRALNSVGGGGGGAANWQMAGTDPETGKPVLLNSRTGETRVSEQGVGMKPGEAERVRQADERLKVRQAELENSQEGRAARNALQSQGMGEAAARSAVAAASRLVAADITGKTKFGDALRQVQEGMGTVRPPPAAAPAARPTNPAEMPEGTVVTQGGVRYRKQGGQWVPVAP